MADGLNRATLIGNLGADPELRFTQGGTAVLNLRLATTTSYVDKDEKRQERTEWHSVTVWGKRGEGLAKILVKGSRVYIEGEIRHSEYEDKEGVKRHKTEIHATNVVLAGGEKGSGGDRREDDRRAPARDERSDDRRPPPRDERRGGRSDRQPWE